MSEEQQNEQYVADMTWNFAGSKGAFHMDGDADSLRTLTIDVTGANPDNAMTARLDFKGDLFTQIAEGVGMIFSEVFPALLKTLTAEAYGKKETISPEDAARAYAAAEGWASARVTPAKQPPAEDQTAQETNEED